jgi:hypothetical protein
MKTFLPTLLLALAFLCPSVGHASSARLLDDDVPRFSSLTPSGSGLGTLGATAGEGATAPGFGAHFGITLLPAVFASTTGVVLAVALEGLSNTLLGVAVPALLSHLLVGPVLTTLVALLVGNNHGEHFGFWGGAAAAFLLHAATFVVGSLLGVAWSNPLHLLLYTLVDGLLMSAGSVGVMHLFPEKVATAELPSFVPGVSATQLVSLSKVEF